MLNARNVSNSGLDDSQGHNRRRLPDVVYIGAERKSGSRALDQMRYGRNNLTKTDDSGKVRISAL